MSRPERVGAPVVAASIFWLRFRAGPLAHDQDNDIPDKRKCRRESAGDWHRNSENAEHEQEHHDDTRSRSQPRLDGQCTRCCVAAPVSDAVSDISYAVFCLKKKKKDKRRIRRRRTQERHSKTEQQGADNSKRSEDGRNVEQA